MQKVKLSFTIDKMRSAEKRLSYLGVYATERVTRVAESVVSLESGVGGSVIDYADVEAILRCQRCNQSLAHQAHRTFSFSRVVSHEQADDVTGSVRNGLR